MLIETTSLLEMFHAVKHKSIWGNICRTATEKDVDSLVMSLKSQSKDNPVMMSGILGYELYTIVNNLTEIQ